MFVFLFTVKSDIEQELIDIIVIAFFLIRDVEC